MVKTGLWIGAVLQGLAIVHIMGLAVLVEVITVMPLVPMRSITELEEAAEAGMLMGRMTDLEMQEKVDLLVLEKLELYLYNTEPLLLLL